MTYRITRKQLDYALSQLNTALDRPSQPYSAEPINGRYQAQPGCIHLDIAYGGTRLVEMCESGGERDITGRGTKRETYDAIQAMLWAVTAAQKT